jgi:hypothetical protein
VKERKLPGTEAGQTTDASERERERAYIEQRTREVDRGGGRRRERVSDEGNPFDFGAIANKLLAPARIHNARLEAEQYKVKPAKPPSPPATQGPSHPGGLPPSRPATQTPSRPAVQASSYLAVQPPSRLATFELAPELQDAIATEVESARKAGALGYMAKLLCQVTMPHRKSKATEIERVNGELTVTMVSPSRIGLPFGTYPRLMMAHITKQAVLTQSPRIELGDSLSSYMRGLGLEPTGGRHGSITRLRQHLDRLLGCSIQCRGESAGQWSGAAMHPVEEAHLWWDAKRPEQMSAWRSELELNARFFKNLIARPVPIDERILRKLAATKSPLAIDIYFWLTHRLSYLKERARIPWSYLQLQFGGDYKRLRDFKAAFLKQLRVVIIHFPVRAEARPQQLWLYPGKTSVPRLPSAGW